MTTPSGETVSDPAAFVRAHTHLRTVPSVPGIRLHLADDVYALWERTPSDAGGRDVGLPFWAFVWPGGVGLARFVLDHPQIVAGRSVCDVATGSGLVAVAAARAGAASVTAVDLDAYALAAVTLNAVANGVDVTVRCGDALTGSGGRHDVTLVGDAFYDAQIADRALRCIDRAHAAGGRVLVGDPGRAHLPRSRLRPVAAYDVPGTGHLEASDVTPTRVWEPV
jgi:predicted nicotinamide N-methyase